MDPHCRIGRIRDKSTGRYVSRRELRISYYASIVARLTPEQKQAAIARACSPTGKGR